MAEAGDELDALVRRVDEDRWLASRFAPEAARQRLAALYALNHEIARTAEVVSDAGIGAIRLAWWRDGLAEVFEGRAPRGHPVLQAFARAHADASFSFAHLEALIEARARDLDQAPFTDFASMAAYVDETAGAVMRLACEACGVRVDGKIERFVSRAALAWGLVGLARARAGCAHDATFDAARAAYGEARVLSRALPSAAFPAIGYLTIVPQYLRSPAPALLGRQLRLVWASATGLL